MLRFSAAAEQSILCSPSSADSKQPSDGNRRKLMGPVFIGDYHAEPGWKYSVDQVFCYCSPMIEYKPQ